jgi:hypothetical protein
MIRSYLTQIAIHKMWSTTFTQGNSQGLAGSTQSGTLHAPNIERPNSSVFRSLTDFVQQPVNWSPFTDRSRLQVSQRAGLRPPTGLLPQVSQRECLRSLLGLAHHKQTGGSPSFTDRSLRHSVNRSLFNHRFRSSVSHSTFTVNVHCTLRIHSTSYVMHYIPIRLLSSTFCWINRIIVRKQRSVKTLT